MVTLLSDPVKRLMSQYTLEIDADSLNKDIICVLCRKIMINAYQSYCGCHFCHVCIVGFSTVENNYCPGGKNVCKEDRLVIEKNVTPNPMLNKIILTAKVHCPNKPCSCIMQLSEIQEHLNVCNEQSTKCPFCFIGCENEEASKENILMHLHKDVYPHSQLLIELIHGLKTEINELKEDIALSKLELFNMKEKSGEKEEGLRIEKLNEIEEQRKKEIEYIKKETNDLKQDIKNQKRETNELKQEIKNQKRETNELKQEIDNLKKVNDERKKELESLKVEYEKRWVKTEHKEKEMMTVMKKEIAELTEYSRNIKKAVDTSQRESTKYRNETRSMLTKMEEEMDTKERAANVTKSMDDVLSKVYKLSRTVAILNVGTNTKVTVGFISFTVDKFSAGETIFSPYFYSHTNGYKLRLQVYPKGRGEARGTDLSLYSIICEGEYDDVLPWPCRHTFTLGITNQRDGQTHACEIYNYATTVDNLRHSFDKPINKDNRGYGRAKFISHADLKSVVGLVLNDSVVIRCVVSAPP